MCQAKGPFRFTLSFLLHLKAKCSSLRRLSRTCGLNITYCEKTSKSRNTCNKTLKNKDSIAYCIFQRLHKTGFFCQRVWRMLYYFLWFIFHRLILRSFGSDPIMKRHKTVSHLKIMILALLGLCNYTINKLMWHPDDTEKLPGKSVTGQVSAKPCRGVCPEYEYRLTET